MLSSDATIESCEVARFVLESELEATLPIIMITAGKIINSNLGVAKVDVKFLEDVLKKAGIEKVADVLILTLDSSGKVFIQTFSGESKNLEIEYKGEW